MEEFIKETARLKEEEIDLDRLTENYSALNEIERVAIERVSEIHSLKKQFEAVIMSRPMMQRVVNELKDVVDAEDVASALRLQRQLEAMERSLPKKTQPEGNPSATEFAARISIILKGKEELVNSLTAANLQPLDQLSAFFQRNASGVTPQLKNMREKWTNKVKEILDILMGEMPNIRSQR